MADGVLLDWEGLLADTADARRASLREALGAEGFPFDEGLYDLRCAGRSVRAAAARMLAERGEDAALVEIVALRAERLFAAQLAHGFAIDPDAARFVELAQLRAPVVIVTAATRTETESALRLAGLHDSCAAIVTVDDVVDDAPSRSAYELAVSHLARRRPVRTERVVALGVTSAAIRAARAAGVRTIAIGAPAHVALEADAALASLADVDMETVAGLLGIGTGRPA